MALPRQVEAQIKELEKLEAQLARDNEPKQQSPETDPVADVVEPAAEPEVDRAPEQDAPTTEKTPETPPSKEPTEETWQQKYRTLKGMYDAEVPRLHAQLKELNARVDDMTAAKQTPPEPTRKDPEKLVTDADVETFGSDLIEVQRRVAREVAQEFSAELEDLRGQNVKLREQLDHTDSQISESSFANKLHRLVPDFEQINTDSRWIDWLNETDPFLRGPRKQIAQQAFATGDAEGVAHYVSLFKQTLAAESVEPLQKKSKELERQIQPNRSSSAAAPVSQKGKIYTTAQVGEMFRKSADLGGRGKLDEARKIEAEIDAAYMEGRVSA